MSTPSKVLQVIEVCVDSVESALAAVHGGADRLEVCGNLGFGGGTTPSTGLLKAIQKVVPNTPIMAMVRPRVGDFKYSRTELDVMIEDIMTFKELGVLGVVFGVLTVGGRVDIERTKWLVEAARPLQVCFHRAIDMTIDYNTEMKRLLSISGITRVLTSGYETSVDTWSARNKISNLVPGLVTILPGSGINPTTVGRVVSELRPREIHLTGARWCDNGMWYRRTGMDMGAADHEWDVWKTSEEAIREVRAIADET